MSDDLIRRRDAIKAITDISENYTGKGKRNYHPNIYFLVDALKYDVPTIEPKRGEWIDKGDRYWYCSECDTKDTDTWDWCHGCGARMKGADDE